MTQILISDSYHITSAARIFCNLSNIKISLQKILTKINHLAKLLCDSYNAIIISHLQEQVIQALSLVF